MSTQDRFLRGGKRGGRRAFCVRCADFMWKAHVRSENESMGVKWGVGGQGATWWGV